MQDRDNTLAWVVVAIGVAWLINATCAEGQTAPDYTEREVLVARLAVNEASWRLPDAEAIAYARATWTVDRLRAGHRRALAPVRTDARAWISDLHPDAHEPAGWPAHLEWQGRHRDSWLAVLATVRRVLDGRVPAHCDTRPQTWGGRQVDQARIRTILTNGGREVCSGTRNAFLRFGGGR